MTNWVRKVTKRHDAAPHGLAKSDNPNYQHGMWKTTIYYVWRSMVARCTCPTNHAYARYGGRGITVSDAWKDFRTFYADMGDRPIGASLDRINNDLGYSKENCRWATAREQMRNRRNCKYIEYRGRRLCMADWADELGIKYKLLKDRMRAGWDFERAISQPPGGGK